MKKGMSKMMGVIISAIIIAILIFYSAQLIFGTGKKTVEEGKVFDIKEFGPSGVEAGSGETALPKIKQSVSTQNQLVDILHNCYTTMDDGDKDNFPCRVVDLTISVRKNELVNALNQRSSHAGEALSDNWSEELTLKPGTYFICADNDAWPNDDDLFLTSNLEFNCE